MERYSNIIRFICLFVLLLCREKCQIYNIGKFFFFTKISEIPTAPFAIKIQSNFVKHFVCVKK